MKFEEVLPALREGKKIRCKNWDHDLYIYSNDIGNILNVRNEIDKYMSVFIINGNWEIYEEIKKKVPYYPILMRDNDTNKYEIENEIMLSDDKDIHNYSYMNKQYNKVVVRLVKEIPELIEWRDE